ncbi:hypothetical protein PCANC_22856 [Puccinia coronata f. sp. avenae]|uniref:Uncharacterized protein n=1 Tax=Puccinia coronata f. sp. avenae TaxID=200324 RepID=A0A2N5U718_9BASI|nr:hypothetical protein PCANC_22856 [Puccinia coronata f. sp. avenae]
MQDSSQYAAPQLNEPHPSKPLPTTSHPQASLPPSVPGTDNRYPPATQSENPHYIPPHHLGYPYHTYHQPIGYQGHNGYNLQAGYHPQTVNLSHRPPHN